MGDREERALGRRTWPIRVFDLGEEPGDDLSGTFAVAGRLAMMWPLAVEAWTVAGLPIPEYSRSETPTKLIRAAESREA